MFPEWLNPTHCSPDLSHRQVRNNGTVLFIKIPNSRYPDYLIHYLILWILPNSFSGLLPLGTLSQAEAFDLSGGFHSL